MSTALGISPTGRAELAAITGRGRRLVSVPEAAERLGIDELAAAKKLARWAAQGWLRRVRRGLYIPVPVDAEDPLTWSEDPLVLANAVWAPCYFSGWTAASHWELTEQLFRTTVVKTTVRVRSTSERLLDHEYVVSHVDAALLEWGMQRIWRDDRRVLLADPARTVVDVLDAPALGGGIRQCAELVAAYLDDHEWERLIEYGDRVGNRTVFKRLGYVVEAARLGHERLVEACRARLPAGVTLLDPSAPASGPRLGRWGLRLNVDVRPREVS